MGVAKIRIVTSEAAHLSLPKIASMTDNPEKTGPGKGSARAIRFTSSWQGLFRQDSIFGAKYYLCSQQTICFYPCIHHFAAFAAPAQVKVGMTDTASYYRCCGDGAMAV